MNLERSTNSRDAMQGTQLLVLMLALLWGVGCHSNGYRKSEAAGRTLRQAAAEVHAESRAIEVTLEALNDLVQRPQGDLKPQFERFSEALDRLAAKARQTQTTRRRMQEKGAEYFATWDRTVTNINYGIVRERSENRRAEVATRFYAVDSRYQEAQAVVGPLITYFADIRTALSLDLTTAGLESVRSIVSNADLNSRKVQLALGRLTEELNTSGAMLSSVATGNAVPPLEKSKVSVRSEFLNEPARE